VSEIHHSSDYHNRSDDARRPGTGHEPTPDSPGRPEGSVYDRDPLPDDSVHDLVNYLDPSEREQGMSRGECAEYLRSQPPDADDTDHDDTHDIDSDIYAILHEDDHLPEPRTRQEAARDDSLGQAPILTGIDTRTDGCQLSERPERHGPSVLASQDGAWPSIADQVSAETEGSWHQRFAELEAANAELTAENTQLGKGLAELETEHAQLGKNFAALEARLERIEQYRQDTPASEIADRRQPRGDREEGLDEQEGRRSGPSDEALLFGATAAGGILTTVADFVSSMPAADAGIAASFLAAGAAGVAWIHKRREAEHGDQSKG
jgi:hypothetical protein